jgi:metal-sulfur cluster biosynthetic enzyme
MITKEQIIEQLETILDPELGVDIWTLGLIYDIEIFSDEHVKITMTYTTPACPLGPQIQADLEDSLRSVGVKYVEVEITFEPPWKPPEDLRLIVGV